MIRGLDVSAAQGLIRWDMVPDEIAFVVCKATEGNLYRDATYARNVADAHAAGRAWSAYHFCRPSLDPIAQAKYLWDAVGSSMPDFRVTLDVENAPDTMHPDELASWLVRIVDETARYFGVPPMIYTYPWFYNSRLGPAMTPTVSAMLAYCPLWMADYSKGETPPDGAHPYVPSPWKDWTMWQTSGNGSSRVPGINGAVDHDVFNGDGLAFRMFRCIPDPVETLPDLAVLASPYDDRDD